MSQSTPETNNTFWTRPLSPAAQSAILMNRLLPGAVIGVCVGGVYALLGGTIDALILRDVPLRVDWATLGVSVLTTSLGCALLGVIVNAPAEAALGIGAGVLAIAVVKLIQGLMASSVNPVLWFLVLIYTFLPSLLFNSPLAILLRWAVSQYQNALGKEASQRRPAQVKLIGALAALAILFGSLAQMPASSRDAVRAMHQLLRSALTAPADAPLPRALQSAPDLRSRAGATYTLEAVTGQHSAAIFRDGVDVTAYFANGFAVTCFFNSGLPVPVCGEGRQSPVQR